MAKFTPGAIISEIRGSIAATTYSRSPAGAYVKAKLIQNNPNTPAQQAVRALTAAAVSAWQTVPQSVRDEWIAFSATQKSRPRIDGTHKLSGYNSWVRFYVIRNQYGLTGNPIPAPQLPIGSYNNMSVSSTPGSINVNIEGNNTNPDVLAVLRMSDGVSQGINSINQSLQKITVQIQAPGVPINTNVIALWESIFGPFGNAAGKKIFLRIDIVNRLTAQIVTVFRGSTIVPPAPILSVVGFSGLLDRAMTSSDALSWNTEATPVDNGWIAVAYSPALGLLCATSFDGSGDRIMTSPDGQAWTIQASPADLVWISITWSPTLNLFCAVAQDGVIQSIMTSPDGIAWTLRNASHVAAWQKITWSPALGLFCAVANSGALNRIMTSPDGINWTSRNAPAANNWSCITWSPALGLFSALASSGFTNRAMTSPDGINWTGQTLALFINWNDIAWSPGLSLFAACSSSPGVNRIVTSPDGVTWTARVTPTGHSWLSIAWSPKLGLFTAVSSAGTVSRIITSPDGINWSLQATPTLNSWAAIVARQ